MRRAHARRRDGDVAIGEPGGETVGEHAQAGNDRTRAPAGHQLHAERRHFEGNEMVALAHVEAPRARDVGRVGEIGHAFRCDRAAAVARLLERHAVLVAPGDVKKRAAVGAEHPLVGRKHQEVGIERAHVERQHAGAMGGVDQERGTAGARRRRNLIEVDEAAVRPMHRGNRHQRERRCAGAVDRGQHGRGPVAVVGPRHHLDREALLRCARHPFEHRGGASRRWRRRRKRKR